MIILAYVYSLVLCVIRDDTRKLSRKKKSICCFKSGWTSI